MDNFGFPDKTLEWSQYNGPALSVLQDAPVVYWDLKTQQNAEVTLTANRTLGNPIGIRKGRTYTLNVVQGGAGSFTLTLGTAYSGTVALTTAAASRTKLEFVANSDTTLVLVPYVQTDAVQTITNKRITPRVYAYSAPGATPTINTDNYDVVEMTAMATAITSLTTNLSGTPTNDQFLQLNFTDDGTARALTFGASFAASTITLPTTTVISTKLSCLFQWNSATSKWVLVGKA